MPQFTVVHTLAQTVEAATAEDAELLARRAAEHAPTLHWPTVSEGSDVYEIDTATAQG